MAIILFQPERQNGLDVNIYAPILNCYFPFTLSFCLALLIIIVFLAPDAYTG